jgi:NADH:ubiquinone oxidoreductase subunit F (NADH-binding)/NADH:ubiquinone oxidoreductase subunit E
VAYNLRQRLNYPRPGRSAVEELLARAGTADRAAIEELARARSEHRELRPSDEVGVARSLDRPVAAVHGAASYYADLRGARGARHIRVCNGTACFVASGGGRHIAEIEQALGVTCGTCAQDGSVSLQAVRCLGYCYAGPSALDGDRPCVGPDLAAQLTGATEPRAPDVPVRAVAAPIVLRGIVKGDSSWLLWPSVLVTGRAERVQYEVRESGLRGRGGAGFPVARKWDAVAASRDRGPRYVVANGDEGDPGSYADRLLMERDPARVLEGLALAALACGAARGVVYVRSEYPQAFARMTDAVIEARVAGHLGHNVHGSGVDLDVEVVSGAGSYVAGEETSLLRSIEGLRGTVRPRPPLPVEHGLWGRPTAVNNIETLAAVPAIVADGGAAYARLGGIGESGTLLVCLNERFARPGAYEVELGTILRDIVEGLGGGLAYGRLLTAVQIGGPLGGFVAPAQLDLPLLNSALAAAGVALGHGSLVAIDERTSPRSILDHLWRFGAEESCGACTPCREGTRRGAADPAGATADDGLLDLMAQASLCGFGRGIPRAIRSLCRAVPMDS